MANPFTRGWKYFLALLSGKLDEHADPRIQIQQAIEEAQRQHQALTQQAAAVIGNQRQLEMKLARQMSEVEKLQGSARQALVLAESARTAGDTSKAAEYEQTAGTRSRSASPTTATCDPGSMRYASWRGADGLVPLPSPTW